MKIDTVRGNVNQVIGVLNAYEKEVPCLFSNCIFGCGFPLGVVDVVSMGQLDVSNDQLSVLYGIPVIILLRNCSMTNNLIFIILYRRT